MLTLSAIQKYNAFDFFSWKIYTLKNAQLPSVLADGQILPSGYTSFSLVILIFFLKTKQNPKRPNKTQNRQQTTGYCMSSSSNKAQLHIDLCLCLYTAVTQASPLCSMWPHFLLTCPLRFNFLFFPCDTSYCHLPCVCFSLFCPFTYTASLPWISYSCLGAAHMLISTHFALFCIFHEGLHSISQILMN